jgi:hypothetical protein
MPVERKCRGKGGRAGKWSGGSNDEVVKWNVEVVGRLWCSVEVQ